MDNIERIPRDEDDIITVVRPEDMSYEEYKACLREQSKRLKKRMKHGVMIHKSSETFKDPETGRDMIRRYAPYLSPSKQARKALKKGNNEHLKINLELKQ